MIQLSVKEKIQIEKDKYKKLQQKIEKENKQIEKITDEKNKEMKERMIEEIIKFVNEHKDNIINSFSIGKKQYINIKLQNLWRDLYPEIYKRQLTVVSWESSCPKRSFYNTDPIDFDIIILWKNI